METGEGITYEEAQARHQGCLIVAVQYGRPVLPDYPNGCWCLLAVPKAKLDACDRSKLPAPLAAFAEFRPKLVRLHVPDKVELDQAAPEQLDSTPELQADLLEEAA